MGRDAPQSAGAQTPSRQRSDPGNRGQQSADLRRIVEAPDHYRHTQQRGDGQFGKEATRQKRPRGHSLS